MTIGALISAYREEHGLSMERFAEIAGISKGYVSRLEANTSINIDSPSPTLDKCRGIAAAMNMSLSELIDLIDTQPASSAPSNLLAFPTSRLVPRIGQIACGAPLLAEENINQYDAIPEYIQCDFTLVCKGDSMINSRIFDGDIVCIRQQEHVENGEIAAVMVGDDEATLKRIRLFEDHLVLEPANPKYNPRVFRKEEMNQVRIIGKATFFISSVR